MPELRLRIDAKVKELQETSDLLDEQGFEIERDAHHRHAALRVERPLLAGTVAVELDAVAVGVVQVDRLADAMVRRARELDPCVDEPPERVGKLLAVGIADGGVVEPGRAGRGRTAAAALPGIQADVVVVVAGGDERGLIAHPLLQLEAEHADVEAERTLDVGHLQANVADVDAGIDRGHLPTIARHVPLRRALRAG